MDFEQITQLKEMGFTPEQIMTLITSPAKSTSETLATEEVKTTDTETTEVTAEQKLTEVKGISEDSLNQLQAFQDSINEKLEVMTKQFQLKNIQDSSMPETETDAFLEMCTELLK